MEVFGHHLYEYSKGLRNMVLHTLHRKNQEQAIARLETACIDYVIREVSETRVNIFFGASECIAVIRTFGTKPLNEYTSEEDFILGTMLGYDGKRQCERYLERSQTHKRPKLCQCALKGISCNH